MFIVYRVTCLLASSAGPNTWLYALKGTKYVTKIRCPNYKVDVRMATTGSCKTMYNIYTSMYSRYTLHGSKIFILIVPDQTVCASVIISSNIIFLVLVIIVVIIRDMIISYMLYEHIESGCQRSMFIDCKQTNPTLPLTGLKLEMVEETYLPYRAIIVSLPC